MSLGACIPQLVADGKLTPEKGQEISELYEELAADFRRDMGDDAAASMASDATIAAMERQALQKRRVTLLQVHAQKRALEKIASFDGGKGGGPGGGGGGNAAGAGGGGGPINPRAAEALFDRDGRATYSNVEGRRKAIRARAHAFMDGILAEHSRNVVGVTRNKAFLHEIVRELFGEDTGILAAREMADAWRRTSDMLRQRFNAAGGAIGRMENWGLPQSHDTPSIRQAGFDVWRAEILPRLDTGRMVDERTGRAFTPQGLDQALRDIFETIRSDGWNKRTPGAGGRGALANQRGESRFLHFKSADDWMAYQERFGSGTAFDSMMGHIDGMSRDIALMEILGPNPNATVRWIKDQLDRTAALDGSPNSKAVDRAFAGGKQIDRLYDEITGASSRPEKRNVALAFSSLRSLQTAAKLGGATLSAVTDVGFQMSTRYLNGLSGAKAIPQYVKLFRPGSKEDQKLAVRLGLIAEEWSQRAAAQGRYLNEELTGETARRLAEGVLRVSGLSRWTQAGRWAFGMEFMGHITDQAAKRHDQLDEAFRSALGRYGIDRKAWDKIRATPLEADRGVDWLKPTNVEDRELGDRLLEMIQTETDFAVPTADLRTRALINSVAPKGTYPGEFVRSAFLFKSFGISMMITHGRRSIELGLNNGAKYAAGLFIGTTLMGALAMQLKAIAAGKDPRPMDDKEFWGGAVLQGGGFGIFGDFLSSSQNRFGGGMAQTAVGPLISGAEELLKIPGSKRPAWQTAKFIKNELPGQSLWYACLAFDRIIADQIQETIDPDYRDAWRRMERRAKEQRTEYWWNPGDIQPDRGPSLYRATGAE